MPKREKVYKYFVQDFGTISMKPCFSELIVKYKLDVTVWEIWQHQYHEKNYERILGKTCLPDKICLPEQCTEKQPCILFFCLYC